MLLLSFLSSIDGAEDRVPPANARAHLLVVRLCVAMLIKVGLRRGSILLLVVASGGARRLGGRTKDARREPPNHTAYLKANMSVAWTSRLALIVLTFDACGRPRSLLHQLTVKRDVINSVNPKPIAQIDVRTRIKAPLLASLASILRSTICLRSLLSRCPKCSNIVEPPDKTMFYPINLQVSGHCAPDKRRLRGHHLVQPPSNINW